MSEGNIFHADIAGVTFANPDGTSRQTLIRNCRLGDELFVVRDKNNEYDSNAVMVMHRVGQLGWMKSAALEEFAEFLDSGGRATAKICQLTGGTPDKPIVGANIEITEWPPVPHPAIVVPELVPDVQAATVHSTGNEARINAELKIAQDHQERVADQLAEQERLCSQINRQVFWCGVRVRYFQNADRCRTLAQRLIGWRLGMVIIYVAALLITVLFCEIVLGFGLAMSALGLIAIGLIAALHYIPGDVALADKYQRAGEGHRKLATDRIQHENGLRQLRRQNDELISRASQLQEEARRANRQWQLQQQRLNLLGMPWKSYRSIEFEQFLKQVFEALCCSVETTKVTGDQGADLVVAIGQRRLAVQVKGYVSSVGNAAVQQAFSAMKFYNCHGCMVITNSLFTASAVDLAGATGCVLIDENRLPDLILGKLDFCQPGVPI